MAVGEPRSGSLDHAALMEGPDVRNLDSMEKDVRMILCQAIQGVSSDSTPASPGLGSRMAALFAGAGLDTPIVAWHGQEAEVFRFSDRVA